MLSVPPSLSRTPFNPPIPSVVTPTPSRIFLPQLSTALPTFIRMSTKPKDARAKGRAVGQTILLLFDKMSICDEAAADIAVAELDRLLSDLSTDMGDVVEEINSVRCLLEFILCVSSDYGFELLCSGILKLRPHTAEEFPASTLYTLLAQFSVSLYLPYARVSDVPPELVANRRSVDLAFSVLQSISLLNASNSLSEETVDIPGTRWAAKSREKQEKRRKRSIHTGRASTVDVKAILEYGTQVPTSKPAAAELAATVIAEQMSVLRDYFSAFRKEETVMFFKRVYLPLLPPSVAVSSQRTDDAASPISPIIPLPSASQGAFPAVQPKTAALYFDNAQGFGPWRVKISGRAERDLRQWMNKDAKMFDTIVDKIRVLSNGNFTKDNHKKLVNHGGDVDVPIYEAKLAKNARLVYHIHCGVDFEDNVERQVIRVFGVYKHDEINARFWETMSRQLNCRGAEYRKRCIFRNKPSYQRGEYVVLPEEFTLSSGPEEEVMASPSTDSTGLTKEDMESLHSLLTLEKFVTFSQAFLNTILSEQDVSHVFDVSPSEKEIIEHDSSCFVIGRSGTGKTTTMVFKILGIERTYDTGAFRGVMAKPRQVFVTQSQVLAEKVEEYYAKLYQSHATAHLSLAQLQEMASKSRARRDRMVNEDEEIPYTSTLPQRYGALDDSHFPLFLTFNHLCRLLEREFRYLVEQEKVDAHKVSLLSDIMKLRPRSARSTTAAYLQDERDSFLDYDKFREIYWKHFPENGLDPDLVWGEFMAVIKGSKGALRSEAGYLERNAYISGGNRTQTLSSEQREVVYTLFEVYMRRKKLNGHYDPADRTRMLIRSLKVARVPGKAVDFIYVDEVQDNFIIDCLVLKTICSNPHGLFLAGDTAQTIAAGSSFKLKDLKTLLYGADEEAPRLGAKRARPETFYLTRNYRSHAGIVNCADSIIQLITEFWPDTIDPLPQEKGMSPGSKPIIFSDQDAARLQRSLFRDSTGGGPIEFGARQCILVRDHAARERLKAEFGKIGQILTVYEAKGLEFDDVLLYNFFGDSTVGYSQWRVLLNCLPGWKAPTFDDGRHIGVCRELKNLYVAITRARQNLWITDCSEIAHPLRRIWAERRLVEEHIPGTPMPTLAVKSDKQEWAEAARLLFVKRQYSEAIDAFERADRPQEQQVALAYNLREKARAAPVNARGKELSQPAAFARAAEAFVEAVPGASELEDRQAYYRIAAECYARSGNDRKAGAAYLDAGEYTLAAKHFRKAGMFDEAVAVVQSHGQKVDPDVAQSIMDVSRLYYIRENKLAKAKELFQDDEALQEYMDDRDLNGPRASLHEQNGEYDEAAECHLREGNDLKAIELFLVSNSPQSLLRAATCVLDGFWLYLSLGAPEENWSDQTVIELSGHAEDLIPRLSNNDICNEMAMFRALSQNDIPALANLGEVFYKQDNLPATLLCLDRVFSRTFSLESASLSEIIACFQTFLVYARILQRLSCVSDPCANEPIRRLFAFRTVNDNSEELFLLPKGCYLYTCLQHSNVPMDIEGTRGVYIPRWDLEHLIKKELKELRERLKERVLNQNEICNTLSCLRPCLLFAASRSCPRHECPRFHIQESSVDSGTVYNHLVHIHVLQIMIFHTLYATDIAYHELAGQQRAAWLQRLYEALYPMSHAIGSLHVLSPEVVQELIRGRHIIIVWIQGFLNGLYPDGDTVYTFLTNLMRTTRLAMLLDRHVASDGLQRIPSAIRFPNKRPQHFLRPAVRGGNTYIVHDLLAAAQCRYSGALAGGVRFLKHVLFNRLNVDISVLCDFVDHLCGAMLISRFLKANGTLDGLTIPKSWLVQLLQDTNKLAHMNISKWCMWGYVVCIGRLLGDVYTGSNAGYLLFENCDSSDLGLNGTRAVFFTRICRNICFWGYNLGFRERGLRDEIHKVISAMKDLARGITSPLCSAYVYAKDWASLERTTFNSLADSTLDEVIQLSQASATKPKNISADVRRLVYSNTDEILALLGATHIPKLSPIANGSRANNLTMSSSSTSTSEDRVNRSYEERMVEANDLETEDEQESSAPPPVEFTDQQMIAASKVIAVYRKYALRKAATKDPLREMRRRIFRGFLANSRTIPWQGSPYRFLFLGAAPYLFALTEILKDHLFRAKSVAKALFRIAQDAELESVQAALDGASRLFKEACRLHKALVPSAVVHRTCDVGGLTRLALAAESLAEQVENATQQGQSHPWTMDLDLFRMVRDSGVLLRAGEW